MGMQEQQHKVALNSLNPQQIVQIKQQLENDVNTLNQSLGQFRFAFQKFEECKGIIANAEAARPTDEILLPLSNSLFIPGHLDNERDVPHCLCRANASTSLSTERASSWSATASRPASSATGRTP